MTGFVVHSIHNYIMYDMGLKMVKNITIFVRNMI